MRRRSQIELKTRRGRLFSRFLKLLTEDGKLVRFVESVYYFDGLFYGESIAQAHLDSVLDTEPVSFTIPVDKAAR